MDLAQTTAPKSDQQNYDDYVAGPKTVTVIEVKAGTAEQPVEIHLAEFPGRPYKPSKSMRRVLVAAWGSDSTVYIGRRMTLIGDPTVRFGGSVTGGIKISHLSGIDKSVSVNLTVTRGKRAPHKVDPLPDVAPVRQRDWLAEMRHAGGDVSELNKLGHAAKDAGAGEDVLGQIRAALNTAKEQQA
jgi:hypothetical protein